MEALPAELTIDILSRLPVKTIIHCKLICKTWRNLVSDHDRLFANLHLSRSLTGFIVHNINHTNNCNDPGILKWVEIEDKADHHRLHYDRLLSLYLNLASILQNTRMRHVGSVNGLICLWQCGGHKFDNTYICNPVNREYMILPTQRFHTDGFPGVVYGFGMSSLTGEYKVVRGLQQEILPIPNKPSQPSVLEAEVYTLGTGHWRSLGPVPVTYRLDTFQEFDGPFLNNHCHWIVRDVEGNHEKIGTFDLEKETFQLFPSLPESVKEIWFHHRRLAIIVKGCLCKLRTYYSELTIWMMKVYGINNSWHKEVVIRRGISVDLEWALYKPIHLIAGLKDGNILIVFKNKMCVFDPQSEMFEDMKMFEPNLSGQGYRPSFLKLQHFE